MLAFLLIDVEGKVLHSPYMKLKLPDVKKAHIAVSLILLVAETGIEPVTRGFSIRCSTD